MLQCLFEGEGRKEVGTWVVKWYEMVFRVEDLCDLDWIPSRTDLSGAVGRELRQVQKQTCS